MTHEDIYETRNRLGLTQEAFAKAVGVSFATVNRWENAKGKPSLHSVRRMQRLLASSTTVASATVASSGPASFPEMVDTWTGRLTLAIGAGRFREEVALMLSSVMKDAYERGARREGLTG